MSSALQLQLVKNSLQIVNPRRSAAKRRTTSSTSQTSSLDSTSSSTPMLEYFQSVDTSPREIQLDFHCRSCQSPADWSRFPNQTRHPSLLERERLVDSGTDVITPDSPSRTLVMNVEISATTNGTYIVIRGVVKTSRVFPHLPPRNLHRNMVDHFFQRFISFVATTMKQEDIRKTAIITLFGLQACFVPFGLKNAAQTFQGLMNTMLFPFRFCLP